MVGHDCNHNVCVVGALVCEGCLGLFLMFTVDICSLLGALDAQLVPTSVAVPDAVSHLGAVDRQFA